MTDNRLECKTSLGDHTNVRSSMNENEHMKAMLGIDRYMSYKYDITQCAKNSQVILSADAQSEDALPPTSFGLIQAHCRTANQEKTLNKLRKENHEYQISCLVSGNILDNIFWSIGR